MANAKETLARILQVDGAIGGCIADSDSGMMLASMGGDRIDLEVAAAGNTEVVRAERRTMETLKLQGEIEDILITLQTQYHIIRPLSTNRALFVFLVIDKVRGNLAMARHVIRDAEKGLVL